MTEQMTQNLSRHREEIQRIQNDADLSEGAKRRLIDEATRRAAEENARLREQERADIEERVAAAERKVLGISYPERASASEKAMIAMSYRDARRQAEGAASDRQRPEALSNLLDQAENSGDTQLAEAVYHVAALRGRSDVAEAYRAGRPAAKRNWESYVQARSEAEDMTGLLRRGFVDSVARRQLDG